MLEYALLVAAVLMAAFFSGAETGLYCVNRVRAWLRADQGVPAARALDHMLRRPRLTISTMLIGTNIGVYAATVLCTDQLRRTSLAPNADLYSSLIMPPILLIFAEVIPKGIFQHHAERLMYAVAWPLRVAAVLFYPVSVLLRGVSVLPQTLLHRRGAPAGPLVSRDTFRFYLGQGADHGVVSPYQRSMAENILRLRSITVGSALTPLARTVMAPEDASPEELRAAFQAHRYSRLPVYRNDPSRVVGVVNLVDLALSGRDVGARELAREVLAVPQEMSVADALVLLRDRRQQLAVVTAEDGRAVGVVTVKDLVEEIVGELEAW